MRRTMAAVLAICAAVAVAGTTYARPAARAAVAPPAAEPAGDGAQQVGTVERVGALLDRLGGPLTLRYPGASYVKVHFDRLLLGPGDRVVITDARGGQRQEVAGPGPRWAMSVDGDTAVVRFFPGTVGLLPLRRQLASLGVGIDRVARGFTRKELADRAAADRSKRSGAARRLAGGEGRTESICGGVDDKRDAVCYKSSDPEAYNRSKAVARLLIDGTELCSGWRVGPGNRMFTNHHCFADSATAKNTEVWFNYECAACGGFDVLRSTKVWGGDVLATDQRLDFTLFTVQGFESVRQFGFLELDVRDPRRGEELLIPQHPGGDPTMIVMDPPSVRAGGNCSVADPAYDGYDSGTDVAYYCDTEGGSSGSPVLSRDTGKVVALHHFGGCPNSGVRIDLIYAALKPLL